MVKFLALRIRAVPRNGHRLTVLRDRAPVREDDFPAFLPRGLDRVIVDPVKHNRVHVRRTTHAAGFAVKSCRVCEVDRLTLRISGIDGCFIPLPSVSSRTVALDPRPLPSSFWTR